MIRLKRPPAPPLRAQSLASTTPSRSRSASPPWCARSGKPQPWRAKAMIDPAAPAPQGNMGQPIPRYDARAKVTGSALYAADVALPDTAYAYLLSSRIAKGRIKAFDLRAAEALSGVLDILTYETIGDGIHRVKFMTEGGPASNSVVPLGSAEIAYAGQTIAMVLAETLEAAQDAA